jgi:hypothetical protein
VVVVEAHRPRIQRPLDEAAPNPYVQCGWMVDRVKQRTAPDNVTLIVVRMRKGRGRWHTQRSIGCVVHAPPRQPLRVVASAAPKEPEDGGDDE